MKVFKKGNLDPSHCKSHTHTRSQTERELSSGQKLILDLCVIWTLLQHLQPNTNQWDRSEITHSHFNTEKITPPPLLTNLMTHIYSQGVVLALQVVKGQTKSCNEIQMQVFLIYKTEYLECVDGFDDSVAPTAGWALLLCFQACSYCSAASLCLCSRSISKPRYSYALLHDWWRKTKTEHVSFQPEVKKNNYSTMKLFLASS